MVLVCGAIATSAGCTSASKHSTRLRRPPPPSYVADEAVRNEMVAARMRVLVKEGKPVADARRIAERETPSAPNSSEAQWSAEYAAWERAKAVQDKFESDLAAIYRK
jgi:hypothetical protein